MAPIRAESATPKRASARSCAQPGGVIAGDIGSDLPSCRPAAFADPVFAKGTFVLAPGSHSIQIQSTHIPFQEFLFGTAGQSLQNSSTVAFKASTTTDPITPTPTPEPGSLVLLGSGCLGWIAHLKRKRSVANQAL